jgi:GNAT superfamily N-acetyltransferase
VSRQRSFPGRLIQLHTEQQRQIVHDFRDRAEKWLAARGMDQFQPDSPTQAGQAHEIIDRVFDRGDFVGLEVDGQLVAVGAVTSPDPDFWTPAERAQPQAYVGRFMVADHAHGYGEQLLARIADEALEHGIPIMRLDCWRTSIGLHDYYRRLGFRHLGTRPVVGRGWGTLFELDLHDPNTALAGLMRTHASTRSVAQPRTEHYIVH